MNRSKLTTNVPDSTPISKSNATFAVSALLAFITNALASGEIVAIARFGTIATRNRAPRQGRNPCWGETFAIAAPGTPSFKLGKTLRDAVSRIRE